MLSIEASIEIQCRPEQVRNIYLDYQHWNKTFPRTIFSTRLMYAEDNRLWIGVQHKIEGFVKNELIVKDNRTVILKEWKPKYDAEFHNSFDLNGSGTLYRVKAFIKLKGFFRLFQPFAVGLIRRRITDYLLCPVKYACETG